MKNEQIKSFKGHWNQKTQRDAEMVRLKNKVFKVILCMVLCVIFAGMMIPF